MNALKFTKWIVLTLLAALMLAGCGAQKESSGAVKPQEQEKLKLNVGYIPAVEDVLYFVAQEKGLFAQEGLEVELFSFNNSGEGVNALRAGKLDVGGFGSSAALANAVKGVPVIDIGGVGDEGAALIAKPENAPRFATTQGFKGAKVGTVRLSTGDAEWRAKLVKEGLDLKSDVAIVELDSPASVLEAVKKGAVDVGIVWVPFPEMAEQQGLKVVQWSDDLDKGHICCRSLVLQETLANKKEALVRFHRALIRAYDVYRNNPEETVESIAKYVKIDKELIKQATYSGHINSHPDPNKKGYQAFWETLKVAGFFKEELDVARFVDTETYREALAALRTRESENKTFLKLEEDFARNNR